MKIEKSIFIQSKKEKKKGYKIMIYLKIDRGQGKGKYVFNTIKEKDSFMEKHKGAKNFADYWYSYDGKCYVNYLDFPMGL